MSTKDIKVTIYSFFSFKYKRCVCNFIEKKADFGKGDLSR
jgi:hypothetical protein